MFFQLYYFILEPLGAVRFFVALYVINRHRF